MLEKAKKYFTDEELSELYGEMVDDSNHGYAKLLFQTIAGMVGLAAAIGGGSLLVSKVINAVICKVNESRHKDEDD